VLQAVIAVLVTAIHRATISGARGWLDTGDKPRYDKDLLVALGASPQAVVA
jgi:hypothetical protein